jgi:predicted  nucleic acid-binding Zn-ribbon protein
MIAHQKFESPDRRHQLRKTRTVNNKKMNPAHMNNPIKNLLDLQLLEFGQTLTAPLNERITALRATIPVPVLLHYDRLADKGKRGVAFLRHQVCTGCHMRVPLGTLLNLMGGEQICLCDNCGRYLYLESQTETATPVAPVKKIRVKSEQKRVAQPA